MNLLLIYGDPRQDMFGGVEEHTNNLIRFLLLNKNIKLDVFTYGRENDVFEENNIQKRVFKRFTSEIWFYIFFLPFDLYRLMREIKKKSPDIIHLQGTHPLYCLTAIFAQRKHPTVITVHGIMAVEMEFHHGRNFLLKFFSKFIERKTLSMIKNIIVVAPQIEEIVNEMNGSNTFMIPNGVNLAKIREIKPLKDEKNHFLFMGILIYRKGVDVLIKACKRLKKEKLNFKLVIAGSGSEEEYFKNKVNDLELNDHIEFVGFIKGDEKYSYLKSADFLVLPSFWESLPIVVLEGMACGKPVVATDVGGVSYLIKDSLNGVLVKPGDSDDLADKIKMILEDKKLQEKMGKNSLKMAEDFEWGKIADKTFETYEKIINEERMQ